MNIRKKGTEVQFDFRYKNDRIRGSIQLATLAKIISGDIAGLDSNLGPLNKVILFEEFAENIYLPKHSMPNKKEKTYLDDIKSVKALNKFYTGYLIHQITAESREQFKQDRLNGRMSKSGKPCSPDRVNNELSCLNQILEYAKLLGYIKQNPLLGLKRLPTGNRVSKAYKSVQTHT